MRSAHLTFIAILLLFSCKPSSTSALTTTNTDTVTTATTTTVPPPQKYPLDHYKFWRVRPQVEEPLNELVTLRGQFDRERPWKAFVLKAELIGNPVEKRRPGYPEPEIQHEQLHYVAYSIRIDPEAPQAPAPPVEVTNQFGTPQKWTLRRPEWLLVPADKNLHEKAGEPPKGDHFVCYAAEGPQAQIPITLRDQFDRAMNRVEEVRDFPPAYLCVPVSKQRQGHPPEEIQDHETHIAIYKITSPGPFGRAVWSNDQFRQQQLNVMEPEYLGVPSHKTVKQ